MTETTTDLVRRVAIAQLMCDADKATDHTTLEALGADSLDAVELLMAVEDELGVSVPDEGAPKHTDTIAGFAAKVDAFR